MDFFSELEALRYRVPRPALHNKNCENSEYGNFCIYNKNCYMVFATDWAEDSMYCRWVIKGKNNLDCTNCNDIQLCYECINCKNCYNGTYLQDCENCTDCNFCFDCVGCQNCFGCVGLRHQNYSIFNKPYSKQEFTEKMAGINLLKKGVIEQVSGDVENLKVKVPCLYGHLKSNEQVLGDYVYNCKNCFFSYELRESQDSAYLNEGWQAFNCYDSGFFGECVDCYECMVAYRQNNCNFCWYCFNSSNLEYCDYCLDCSDCFGCVGLQHKKYHILNKPFEKEEYLKELAKIKEELKSRGEYGRKFPQSTYRFEDTLAADM